MTRWNLSIEEETDRRVRMHLARRGMKKGDLSKFVASAVRAKLEHEADELARREALGRAIDAMRARFADLDADEADELADEAVRWARANPA